MTKSDHDQAHSDDPAVHAAAARALARGLRPQSEHDECACLECEQANTDQGLTYRRLDKSRYEQEPREEDSAQDAVNKAAQKIHFSAPMEPDYLPAGFGDGASASETWHCIAAEQAWASTDDDEQIWQLVMRERALARAEGYNAGRGLDSAYGVLADLYASSPSSLEREALRRAMDVLAGHLEAPKPEAVRGQSLDGPILDESRFLASMRAPGDLIADLIEATEERTETASWRPKAPKVADITSEAWRTAQGKKWPNGTFEDKCRQLDEMLAQGLIESEDAFDILDAGPELYEGPTVSLRGADQIAATIRTDAARVRLEGSK